MSTIKRCISLVREIEGILDISMGVEHSDWISYYNAELDRICRWILDKRYTIKEGVSQLKRMRDEIDPDGDDIINVEVTTDTNGNSTKDWKPILPETGK